MLKNHLFLSIYATILPISDWWFLTNLTKGLPKHAIGDARNAIDELAKKGFILSKHTSYGLQVSLNPEKIEDICEIIEG